MRSGTTLAVGCEMKRVALGVMGLLALIVIAGSAIAGDFKRDYEPTAPLAQTGRLTIRKPIQVLPAKSLFDRCPAVSHLEEFAESTQFLIMVCRDDRNDLKKYWIQKTRKTGKVLRLTARDAPQSQPSGWKNGGYTVYLYSDGRQPEQLNAYVESYNTKTQQGQAEALLYHYSKFYDRR